MSYEYIKRTYLIEPKVGQRIEHDITKRLGQIAREDRSRSHYVMVRFDGDKHSLPCHPLEIGLCIHPPAERTET